jgi:hypothetical protein
MKPPDTHYANHSYRGVRGLSGYSTFQLKEVSVSAAFKGVVGQSPGRLRSLV